MARLYFHADLDTKGNSELGLPAPARIITSEGDANLIGSLCENGLHMPVLDIDRIPVRVVPSSTPGNSHLYIDKELSWTDYRDLLELLARVGILESGYVQASIARETTFVRKPGVPK